MNEQANQAAPEPTPAAVAASTPTERGTWSLSVSGLRTVATLELRQRVRSTRWKVALVVWFVVVGGITLLTTGAFSILGDDLAADGSYRDNPYGGTVYSIVALFVLFLGLLVAPTLSAASINGDRNAGTLATLQQTLLTPAEIVVGKLLAAWAAALAFLAAGVPFILLALIAGGVRWLSLLTTLLMLALMLGVICAIGLGFSALVARTSGSAVLTYLTIGTLTVVLPIVFGLLVPVTTTDDNVRVWTGPPDYRGGYADPECRWESQRIPQWHSERTWWLLAPNPFVVVADAQPLTDHPDRLAEEGNILAMLQYGVRATRTGPPGELDWCYGANGTLSADSPVRPVVVTDRIVWPWGLGVDLLLAVGGVVLAVRRLRIPQAELPRGMRVA